MIVIFAEVMKLEAVVLGFTVTEVVDWKGYSTIQATCVRLQSSVLNEQRHLYHLQRHETIALMRTISYRRYPYRKIEMNRFIP